MNYGGSRKTISSAYGNVSGSRKQIYPYSKTTTYTYRWKRYKYETGIEYQITGPHSDGDRANAYPGIYFGSGYEVTKDTTNGTITVSLTGVTQEYTEPSYALYEGIGVAGFAKFYTKTYTPTKANPKSALVYIGWITMYTGNGGTYIADYFYRVVCSSLDGQTKVFDRYVTSTNRNAYPDAGDSGSYYYEFYDQY